MKPIRFVRCSFSDRVRIERRIQGAPRYTARACQLRGDVGRGSIEWIDSHGPTVETLFSRIQHAIAVEVVVLACRKFRLRWLTAAVFVFASHVAGAVECGGAQVRLKVSPIVAPSKQSGTRVTTGAAISDRKRLARVGGHRNRKHVNASSLLKSGQTLVSDIAVLNDDFDGWVGSAITCVSNAGDRDVVGSPLLDIPALHTRTAWSCNAFGVCRHDVNYFSLTEICTCPS